MKVLKIVGGILVLAVLLTAGGAFYIVSETEQVVITQFGKPVGAPVTSPGLHVKLPFVQEAHYFDRRFLAWDGDPTQIPTKDKRFIWVDTYARWRISDPLLFFQRLRDERGAQSRLDDILDGETRNVVAKHKLIELVRSTNREVQAGEANASTSGSTGAGFEPVRFGRMRLAQEVLKAAQARTQDLGIEILDFRFKRINYVEEVRREVYARMISERKRIAEEYRSEGAGEAARISGQMERELRVIRSEAYRKAQEIRGKADEEAARIYAEAYRKNPEFYRFLKTLETYKNAFKTGTTVILSTDSELLRLLEGSAP